MQQQQIQADWRKQTTPDEEFLITIQLNFLFTGVGGERVLKNSNNNNSKH